LVTIGVRASSSTVTETVKNDDGTDRIVSSVTTTISAPFRGSIAVTWWVDRGFIQFDFPNNKFGGVEFRGGAEALAAEMINVTRGINSNYLSGRTTGGMMADLRLHYAAYAVDKFDLTHRDFIARIGGTNTNMPGYDSNAWFFETANVQSHILQLMINPFDVSDVVRDVREMLFR